jgi:hypothetical protein
VWQSGFFAVESIGLGELVQQGALGEYGALPPEFYWSRGYIQDFLISHCFLRQYATWTIDFDRMIIVSNADSRGAACEPPRSSTP